MSLIVLSFFGAVVLSTGLTPVMIRLAEKWHVFDAPGGHKTHSKPIPYMGGLAIVLAVGLMVTVWAILNAPAELAQEIIVVALVAVCFAVLGFIDDIKNLTPSVRLVVEVTGAFIIVAFASRAQTGLPDVLDFGLSVLWIVAVVNAVNMLDHQDGLTAGTTAISAAAFTWIAWKNNQTFVPALCGTLAGASIGFLKSNFHPAKIYMGDSGAYFLGLLLAYAGLKTDTQLSHNISVWIAPLVIAVPVIDSSLVVLSRIRNGLNPLKGGKDHTSHRLMRAGLSKPVAVISIYCTSIYFVLLALFATVFTPALATPIIIFGGISAIAITTVLYQHDPGYKDAPSVFG